MATHTFEWTSGDYGIRFIINQTNNPDANTSTLSISELYIKGPGVSVMLDGSLQINGQTAWTANMYEGTHIEWVSGWTATTVGTQTAVTVPHNDDGSLTITLTLKPRAYSGFLICDYPGGSKIVSWSDGTSQSQAGVANDVGRVNIYTSSGWVKAIPYVYTSSGWVKAIPYIYTSSGWTKAK